MAERGKDEGDSRAIGTPIASLLPPAPLSSTANAYPDFSAFTHTPFYCEENVYLLCKKLCLLGLANPTGTDLFVVFISNDDKKIPLWHQRASKLSNGLVIWDYHVICIQKKAGGSSYHLVWDLDSNLPFPLLLSHYVSEAFCPQVALNSTYRRFLRVIHAPIFLCHFGSNRSHMKDSLGNWISPPPAYESIIAEDGSENNLEEYMRIGATDAVSDIKSLTDGLYSNKFGIVISETLLEAFFSPID